MRAGETACREFAEYGLSLDYVRMVEGEKTGLAPIMIDKDGNNAIMVFPGAHGHYTKEDIDRADREFDDAFMASFVFETNLDMTGMPLKRRMKKCGRISGSVSGDGNSIRICIPI